jgi:hypothetical protein
MYEYGYRRLFCKPELEFNDLQSKANFQNRNIKAFKLMNEQMNE